jgi:hypothetical protein
MRSPLSVPQFQFEYLRKETVLEAGILGVFISLLSATIGFTETASKKLKPSILEPRPVKNVIGARSGPGLDQIHWDYDRDQSKKVTGTAPGLK